MGVPDGRHTRGDMLWGRIPCAVHTKAHVVGIGFLNTFWEIKKPFLIGLFF